MFGLELIHFILNIFVAAHRKRIIRNSYKVNPSLTEIIHHRR